MNAHSAVPGLNRLQVYEKKAILPDYNEQEVITKILSDLDTKIELNKQQNKTLEAIGQAIFKHWFIDFDFPDKNGKPYRSFGGKMVDSELGQIPDGWIIKGLIEIADFTRGFSYKGFEKRNDGNHLFITLNSIYEGGGFKRDFCYIESERLKERHFIDEEDIIITNTEQTKRGTLIGFPALVEFPQDYRREKKAVFSHHITKIIPKGMSLKHYLFSYLFFNQKRTVGYTTGSVILGLDVSNWIKNEKIIIPNSKILQQYHDLMEKMLLIRSSNNKENEVLTAIRDLLLPKLMSGKIRVPVSTAVSGSA
jgi:type I restriction enzyme S subunit